MEVVMKKVSPLIAALFLLLAVVECDRRASGRSHNEARKSEFQSKCGTAPEVAKRIGDCMEPIMQIMKGQIGIPKDDGDLRATCDRFEQSEKCIRATSKDCLTSIHKAASGTIAAAIRKFRNAECKTPESRAKYLDAEKCCINKGRDLEMILSNHTAITQAIRDQQNVTPEQKILKFCCLLDSLNKEVERVLNPVCPREVPVILGILQALTDDARASFCVKPKCQNTFRGLIPARLKSQQEFLEPLAEILFMMRIDE